MSSSPATSSGYAVAKSRETNPPNECPTTTYGGSMPAPSRRAWSSAAWSITVSPSATSAGRGSLVPVPARSYAHTREMLASGTMRSK